MFNFTFEKKKLEIQRKETEKLPGDDILYVFVAD